MGQYSLFEDPKDQVNSDFDASMKPWAVNYGPFGDYQFRAGNPVLLERDQSLIASTIYQCSIRIPGFLAADYDMGYVAKTFTAFRISVIANANQTSYAKCEYLESRGNEAPKKVVAYFQELPMQLLENPILEPVYEFSRQFWHKHKPVEKLSNLNIEPPQVRYAKLDEQVALDRFPIVQDLSGNNTGWRKFERTNLGNQLLAITLVSLDGKYAIDHLNKIPTSGSEQRRTVAMAHAYAIDHPYVAVTPAHEHVGFNIYPLWMKSGELMYAVQTIDNFRQGRQSGLGDSLFKTVNDAHVQAEGQKKNLENILAQEAKDIEIDIEKVAEKLANSLLSISERRANSVLDKAMNYSNIGLLNGTRCESMELAVSKNCEFVAVDVNDEAAKNRDLKIIEQVKRKGYMLGLSNDNIPLVKDGLAAEQRLKENNYVKPEYRLYRTNREDGVFRDITKTEYEYAMKFKQKGEAEKSAANSVVKSSGISR